MNLRVDRSIHTADTGGWFSNYTHFYAYVKPSSPEIAWKWKLPWWVAIKRAERRLAWFENLDFSRVLSDQIRTFDRKVSPGVVRREGTLGLNLGDTGVVLKSRDRTMDARLISKDLARSFLSSGGELRLNTAVTRVRNNEVETDSGALRARHIIIASGSECGRLTSLKTRVVYSPLMVAYPALLAINFVKMTPHMDKTVNHLYHKTEGLEYSVIGSALYYPDQTETARKDAEIALRERFSKILPLPEDDMVTSVYFGPKTELVQASQLRNYQYHIIDTENGTVVLPGKFSLLFSTAANTCRHFGVEPLNTASKFAKEVDPAYLESIVAWPRHYLRMREALERSQRSVFTLKAHH